MAVLLCGSRSSNPTLFRGLFAAVISAFLPGALSAGSFTFTDSSIKDAAHGTAYTWGLSPTKNSTGTTLGALETAIKDGKTIGTATLTISGLWDWTTEPDDVLYVNLLNNVGPGNESYTYNGSPVTDDTSFGPDVFDVVTKPTAPVDPVKPTAPTKPTFPKPKAPTAPTQPAVVNAPAPLPPHPTPAQTAAYKTAEAKYNTYVAALATYNTKLAVYNLALATYNANLATYNADWAAYNAAYATYTTNLATYNTVLLPAYTTAEAAYKAALTTYNNYINTQSALGFTGVAPSGGLYDQANSLLVSSNPNGPGTWTDKNGEAGKTNLTITFSAANISLLDSLLLGDGSTTDLGLGFGPDCHFYDTKITLAVTTVPDGGMTLILAALGIAGVALVGLAAKRRARV